MIDLDRVQLKSILHYNPDTGEFIRIEGAGSARVGDVAGAITPYGYLRISVKSKLYFAHRLAFLYMTGNWPSDQLDHINRIRDDNRWNNLRECNQSENSANGSSRKNNTSGFKGVCWNNRDKKWQAGIGFEGKMIAIGLYKQKEQAALAYNEKALELFGEFAYLNEVRL